jgi:hypothetical protein
VDGLINTTDMKAKMLKIAGVKSEKEFYKLFPTEEAFMAKHGKAFSKAKGGINLGDADVSSGLKNIIEGSIQLKEDIANVKKAKQYGKIAELAQKAVRKPEVPRRRYIRPEDTMVNSMNPMGSGADFLQMEMGGNVTEIQNMYSPGDIYSDMGYEPLDDSNIKQYQPGGKLFGLGSKESGQLGGGLGSLIGGGSGRPSGASQVGSGVGSIAGMAIGGPLGAAIGSALGGAVGGLIGGGQEKKIKEQERKIGNLAFQSGVVGLQDSMSAYMENGGWVSNDWQPQVIAKFGEYDVKDLLKAPNDADMLRSGGHLKDYTAPSARAMSTERPDFQMGGELQTYWGGYAEPISQNPYLPDGGETVMFRGQSHDESDGQGRTGIGITYGDNPVEVERGEPAVKLRDGGSNEENLVVFGNMKIPSYGVSELDDPKAKGMKFKTYTAGLSKIENKANKTTDKALKLLEDTEVDSPFDLLSISTAKAMLKGSDMKLKDAAMKKQTAASIQSAILDTAEEMGVESDSLSRGKIKSAKSGGKFTSAQVGINQPLTPIPPVNTYYQIPVRENQLLKTTAAVQELVKQQQQPQVKKATPKSKVAKASAIAAPIKDRLLAPVAPIKRDIPKLPAISSTIDPEISKRVISDLENLKLSKVGESEDEFDMSNFLQMVNPYLRPGIQNRLDPGQLAPEMFALSANQLEPVQAQLYTPLLEEVSRISLQDQLNEIQAEANAARRMVGGNPAAQAAIAAQAASAKNKVLGEQFRVNQAMEMESRRRNLATLNDATLKNLGILDQQYQRQSQAKSATKAQAFTALSSIADKIAKNKAETLSTNVMANMYPQYTFGPNGRIYNTGLTSFNTQIGSGSGLKKDAQGNDLIPIYGKDNNITGYRVKEDSKPKKGRNGSIVKAIKNL